MPNYISTTNNNKSCAPRPEAQEISAIVITYSSRDNIGETVATLLSRGASVHYTIRQDGFQDQHHTEDQVAFFAGNSSWGGEKGVNQYGIGIMLVNDDHSSYPDVQIDKLIALIKDIWTRHGREMEVVGLGEVNKNHIAPGKLFPWKKLAESGIGKFVEVADDIDKSPIIKSGDAGEQVLEIQRRLKDWGYDVPQNSVYDEQTSKFVGVFKARYLPNDETNSWNAAADSVLSSLHFQRSKQASSSVAENARWAARTSASTATSAGQGRS